jgi:hypothetical protein
LLSGISGAVQLDIAYRIENQSIFIFEIRPEFQNPNSKIEIEVDEPDLFVDSIEEVIEIIKSDDHACFWG